MRKLLGYRLKDEFKYYEKAAAEIAYKDLNRQVGLSKNGSGKINFNPGSAVHDRLKQAGVMHWFEEVYEEEKPNFKIGDLVVTEKGCYLSSGIVKKIKDIKEDKIYIDTDGFWRKEHTRHATEEEKRRYYSLNGKTAIIDGVEYELKIKN